MESESQVIQGLERARRQQDNGNRLNPPETAMPWGQFLKVLEAYARVADPSNLVNLAVIGFVLRGRTSMVPLRIRRGSYGHLSLGRQREPGKALALTFRDFVTQYLVRCAL